METERERVLIVEDEIDFASALALAFELEGVAQVRTASSVQGAEQWLASGYRPSLVVLDLSLGSDRGEEFARWLRSEPQWASVPILALSGDLDSLRGARGLVDACFLKPADAAIILKAARAADGERTSGS